jgi:hypothetical protein
MRISPLSIGLGLVAAVFTSLAWTSSANATSTTFNISANGAKEVTAGGVPNQGDPDGLASGSLTLDNGTGSGTTGFATFSITLSNIDLTTLSGHHIHNAPSSTTGGIVLDFGDPDNIRSGSILSGTISNLNAATITSIFSNPSNFYYNMHNGAFPGGAVRDQLTAVPEPGVLSLLAVMGAAAMGARRPRRRGAATPA